MDLFSVLYHLNYSWSLKKGRSAIHHPFRSTRSNINNEVIYGNPKETVATKLNYETNINLILLSIFCALKGNPQNTFKRGI